MEVCGLSSKSPRDARMRIVIVSNHVPGSRWRANIHEIFDILYDLNPEKIDVKWLIFPLSFRFLRLRNWHLISGIFDHRKLILFRFCIFPSWLLKKFGNKLQFLFVGRRVFCDTLIIENPLGFLLLDRFAYKTLVYSASDDLRYLGLSDSVFHAIESNFSKVDKALCVLPQTASQFSGKGVVLRNPNVHKNFFSSKRNRKNIVCYVGANKCDIQLLKNLLDSGITVRVYSEHVPFSHELLDFRGVIAKQNLPDEMSDCKVGIIPFETDQANEYMELPLKAYDYMAAGLHVVMVSSAPETEHNRLVLRCTKVEFVNMVRECFDKDVDTFLMGRFLQDNGLDNFSRKMIQNLGLQQDF
jgi:hypothetical protein